jgi:stress-induced morphogen
MVFGASVALAQPAAGPHGQGPGAEMIGRLIAHAKAELNLNTMQQSMFDAAVASSKGAHQSARASQQKVKDALKEELAKPEPNLNLRAVAAVADSARNDAQTLRTQVREKWLQLYDTFSTDQKAVVKTLLQNRMAHAESFRQKMMERIHERMGTTGG